jgi:hypothetical protein
MGKEANRIEGMGLKPWQIAEVYAREAMLLHWRRLVLAGADRGILEIEVTRRFVEEQRAAGWAKLSRSTLQVWARAYRADGLLGLVDRRWLSRSERRRPGGKSISPFLGEVRRRYLANVKLGIPMAHYFAMEKAEQMGWATCTLRVAERFIRRCVLPTITREKGIDAGATPEKGSA